MYTCTLSETEVEHWLLYVSLNSMFATYQVKQLRSQKSFITTKTHNITVNPVQDRRDGGCTNCRAGALDHPFWCVTQTLEDAGLLCATLLSTTMAGACRVKHVAWLVDVGY